MDLWEGACLKKISTASCNEHAQMMKEYQEDYHLFYYLFPKLA